MVFVVRILVAVGIATALLIGPLAIAGEEQPGVHAVDPTPLTLTDLEQLALDCNPTLIAARSKVEAARGEWLQVGLGPNPTGGYVASEIGSDGTAGQQGLFLGQEVVRGRKLRLNREVASHAVRQAEEQFTAQQWRVINDVRRAFYDVLAAQKSVEVSEALLTTNERVTTLAEDFAKAKQGTRTDLLQARVERSTTRIALDNARNRHQAAWRTLVAVVGQPDFGVTPLSGQLDADLPRLDFDGARGHLLRNSPELSAASAAIERARSAVSRARVEPIPNVELQGSVQYDYSSRDTIAGVQIGMPIPFRNRNQGGIQKASSELQAAQADYERIELNLERRLSETWERYANAEQQVQRYREEILPDAKESMALVTEGYKVGELDFLPVLTAQRTYLQTNLSYITSMRQLREAAVELNGLLLMDSLQFEGSLETK